MRKRRDRSVMCLHCYTIQYDRIEYIIYSALKS